MILAGSLLLQLNTLCFHARGAAGEVDLSFDPGSGVNGTVNAVVVQPDGKVIIGGEFTTVKGLARPGLARLNADGSGDSSFNPGAMPGGFISLGLQSDGKLLVGNYFGILRLNADGSQDTNFVASLILVSDGYGGFYASVYSMAVQPDGKMVIGGDFYTQNGTNTIYGLARLNANGSLDQSFHYGGAPSGANALTVQPTGKVLFITSFNTLARLNNDGSPDVTFQASAESGSASVMSLQPDGKILVAGYSVSGSSYGIKRLNGNGSPDSSFNPSLPPYEGYPFVGSLVAQPDGKVLFTGGFTTINGTNRNGVARLNADGSLDNSFNPGTSANDSVSLAALQPDGKVLIGGNNGIARLNSNGTLDGSFQPGAGLAGPFTALVVQPDGKVLIGGPFTFMNGTNRYGSARLNADGSLDGTFISSTNFNPNLAALNQSNDCPPGYNCDHYTEITATVVQPDGKVLLGGDFATRVWGQQEGEDTYTLSRYFLARFNADGSPDTGFAPLVGNSATTALRALTVQPDGKAVLIGNFLNGTNWSAIIRINANGTLDNSFNAGTGVYGLSSVASQPDGKVLIAGNFSSVNGTIRRQIARLNANGSLDSTFDPNAGILPIGGGSISAIALQPDGKMLIGGGIYILNDSLPKRLVRLNANGSLDTSFHIPSIDGYVMALAFQSDGKMLIGGDFTIVNGEARPRVARLYGDSVAPSLNIARSNAFVIVSWPVTGLNFQLQGNTNLSLPNSWSPVAQPAVTNAGQISVTVPTTAPRKFFRLTSP
jgi:uncharacterized delta-60 repeat protein